MKTEAAIRGAIRDMKTLMKTPCVDGPGLCLGCISFRENSLRAIEVLKWVLEENDDLDRRWESMAADATRARESVA